MTITNLVETMQLVRYPWTVEITYERGGYFLGHKFKNSLIKNEYSIKNKPASPGNTQKNVTIERINQVLGNLVRTYNLQETYVDYADPWMEILAAVAFAVQSMYHRTREKILGQIFFGQDTILPINHTQDWKYIYHGKQAQINKDFTHENITRTDYNYRVGGKVLIKNKSAYK